MSAAITCGLPRALFHGTTSRRATRIDHEGLRVRQKPRWPNDGNRRFLYFVEHPGIARHWASSRKDVQAVVYFVDIDGLDLNKLEVDPADTSGEYGGLWRYPRDVSIDHLVRCEISLCDGVTVVKPEQRHQLVQERLKEMRER